MDDRRAMTDLLAELRALATMEDLEADARWDPIRALHGRADRTAFEAAAVLAASPSARERILAYDVLAQLGVLADRPFMEETIELLLGGSTDEDPRVIDSMVSALGHVGDGRGLPAILAQRHHADDDIRFSVAVALVGVRGDPPEPDLIDALLELMTDPDPAVRDWATFGIGTQLEEVDSPEIRGALAARLHDEEGDTAGEALLGLALRGDERALPELLRRLDDHPGNLIMEAAEALGAPEALPALLRLHDEGWQADDPRPGCLDDAIAACSRTS